MKLFKGFLAQFHDDRARFGNHPIKLKPSDLSRFNKRPKPRESVLPKMQLKAKEADGRVIIYAFLVAVLVITAQTLGAYLCPPQHHQ